MTSLTNKNKSDTPLAVEDLVSKTNMISLRDKLKLSWERKYTSYDHYDFRDAISLYYLSPEESFNRIGEFLASITDSYIDSLEKRINTISYILRTENVDQYTFPDAGLSLKGTKKYLQSSLELCKDRKNLLTRHEDYKIASLICELDSELGRSLTDKFFQSISEEHMIKLSDILLEYK